MSSGKPIPFPAPPFLQSLATGATQWFALGFCAIAGWVKCVAFCCVRVCLYFVPWSSWESTGLEPLLYSFGGMPHLNSGTSSVLKPHFYSELRELYFPGQLLPVPEAQVLVLGEN